MWIFLPVMSAGVAGSSAQRYPAAPANVIFTFPVLAPGPSPAVTVSVQRTPSGAAVTVIVPSPCRMPARISMRNWDTTRSTKALEVTVMRLVPAGSKRRSAGASESVTSAEARGAGHGDGFAGSLAAAVRTPTSTDVPRGMSSTRKVPLPTPAEGSTVTAAEAGSQ